MSYNTLSPALFSSAFCGEHNKQRKEPHTTNSCHYNLNSLREIKGPPQIQHREAWILADIAEKMTCNCPALARKQATTRLPDLENKNIGNFEFQINDK